MKEGLITKVIGHVRITEHDCIKNAETGEYTITNNSRIILDKHNAVHPANMARIIARALANEPNSHINRIAFGNGGTFIDAGDNITFNLPRDGLNPGDNGWEARLYNETYSEVVDDSSTLIGQGPGALPGDDPISVEHVSGPGVRSIEEGVSVPGSTISSVVVTVVLNPGEPTNQQLSAQAPGVQDPEADFVFDEIGLFSSGASNVATAGYQNVLLGTVMGVNDTTLAPSSTYNFTIAVNGGAPQVVTVNTPSVGTGTLPDAPTGAITFDDLATVLQPLVGPLGVTVTFSDYVPSQTTGPGNTALLTFQSNTTGATSSIALTDGTLFASLAGFGGISAAVAGANAGVRNLPTDGTRERERMLSHLIFSPVLKSSDRALTITYTLNIVVARTST